MKKMMSLFIFLSFSQAPMKIACYFLLLSSLTFLDKVDDFGLLFEG